MTCEITRDPIKIEEIYQKVVRRDAGAVTTFVGTVRELTHGKKTLYLDYEAYESMALKKMEQIVEEMKERWPVIEVAMAHRIGRLEITDIAIAIAVSAPHRPEAYEANRYALERVKEMVPIWKKEHWEDGEEWVGNQQGTKEYVTGKPEEGDLLE
ncbi:molybdenum cofactor biosynthesis protein MoaE [Siminovitchia acidinfaciens]|uniref:Molybdopterin synthase catalytic subunit n=1 Tax=Siminovitchia acidinfaciens TaxID=2321395 RepID=A0A429Y6G4_9BACI|nr:molybdenum cofactor biosynthesis protein MoaE [Siminovitchia acidinfaciens]RST77016.1 molybdenum cofactor biosynthesis protein MoaE [Siminovitchia acidinfaciens]